MDELVVVVLGGETAAPQRRCGEEGMATGNVGRRLAKADGGWERRTAAGKGWAAAVNPIAGDLAGGRQGKRCCGEDNVSF
jgi:hypothetical protein